MPEKMEIDHTVEQETSAIEPSIIKDIDDVGKAREYTPLGEEQETFNEYNKRLAGNGPELSKEEREDYIRLRELSEKKVAAKLIETKQTLQDSSEGKI